MIKVQIDSNKYLTGLWSITGGDLVSSIEMASLPSDNKLYYTAYQILTTDVSKTITVNEPILKQREEEVPVLDEDGNPTEEVTTEIIEYYEDNFVEKEVIETVYYYHLDEDKKQQIINDMQNPPTAEPSLKEKVTSLETSLDEMANIIIMISMK